MLRHIFATAVMAAGSGIALAQIVPSLSLDPSAPTGRVVVDVFVDVAPTDAWSGMGIRAIPMNGAALHYGADPDGNAPVPNLVGPNGWAPIPDQYVTSVSSPRNPRDSEDRFDSEADATLTGRWSPPAATAVGTPAELNATWGGDPPANSDSPSLDGFVARIALDFTLPADATLGVGETQFLPPGATVILLSEGHPSRPNDWGLATLTVDNVFAGFDWAIWYVPEPGTLALLGVTSALCAWNRRR